MPEGILRRTPDTTHVCPPPPDILTYEHAEGTFGEPGWTPPRIVDRIPDGSTWTCDECGRTLVVMPRPTRAGRHTVVIGGPEWREETRWQRRRRRWHERRACTCPGTGLPPRGAGYRAKDPCPVHPRKQAPRIPTVEGKKPL